MLTSTLENVLNRGLPRSARAQQLCAELNGRRIALEAPGLTRLVFESAGGTLRISRGEGGADAEIVGGPLSLLLLGSGLSEDPLRRGAIEIRGDAEIARTFQELLQLLRPDVEEELSLLVGDVPAHRLGRLARGALAWTHRAATTVLRDLGEYAGHERLDLVPRQEGEAFLRDVDTLREDVDRFEARLALRARRTADS